MTTYPAAVAFLVAHALRLGPLRLSIYGACATLGLILAMSAARRLARGSAGAPPAGPDAVWDAGMFAILSCFLASRLLLVLHDPQAFVRYPMLVLGLPSLTLGGMAVAAGVVWLYLRRKGLSILAMTDLYAAPAALLAAFLELGHALDGSEVGMPSTLPWAVHDPAVSATLRFHPVALYGVALALLLAGALAWLLRLRPSPGGVAGIALLAGGAAAFGLDMWTLPSPAFVDAASGLGAGLWIEPGQWIAMAAMLGGASLFALRSRNLPESRAGEAGQPQIAATHMHTEVH